LYDKKLEEMENHEAEQRKFNAEFREIFSTPYTPAASGHVDEILIPSETRPRLIASLELLKDKRVESRPKKHGNMPL
jgi:acetyl-CoA carboxylase carboxyltransferase component